MLMIGRRSFLVKSLFQAFQFLCAPRFDIARILLAPQLAKHMACIVWNVHCQFGAVPFHSEYQLL